jgi:hypothetical protein
MLKFASSELMINFPYASDISEPQTTAEWLQPTPSPGFEQLNVVRFPRKKVQSSDYFIVQARA